MMRKEWGGTHSNMIRHIYRYTEHITNAIQNTQESDLGPGAFPPG